MWNDVRLAARLLRRERWFSIAAVSALALGIGANTTIFTVVNAAMLRDLPIDGADRMLVLTTENASNPRARFGALSYRDFGEWQAGARTFDAIAGHLDVEMNVAGDATPPVRVEGSFVSANTFSLIGERPVAGRDFLPDDDRAGAEPVVVIGHSLWTSRYGGDRGIVGRVIRVNGTPVTVIGVMREGFGFPQVAEIWQPLSQLPEAVRENGTMRPIVGVGRMKSGVTIEQARADLEGVAAGLARRYPDTNAGVRPRVVTLREDRMSTRGRIMMTTLMAAVGFVLLVACANVANLMLARASRRTREVSVRISLGASRWRVVRQLLAESLLLAMAAGGGALAISVAGVGAFRRSLEGQGAPYWLNLAIDGQVFAFTTVICLVTVVAVGLVPALHASRVDLAGMLHEASRAHSGGRSNRRWTGGFVVVQVALTLILMTGAALSTHDLVARLQTDLGIETSGLIIAQLGLPAAAYPTAEDRAAFYRRLDQRLTSTPGIRATIASAWPRGGGVAPEVVIDGRVDPGTGRRPRTTYLTVGLRYFETLGTLAVRGRDFTDADRGDMAIVNERFAMMHFAGDAIGRRIRIGANPDAPETPWLTIVGIAPNVRQRAGDEPGFDPIVYVPYSASPLPFATILARSAAGVEAVARTLRDGVRALDPDLPVQSVMTLDAELARDRWEVHFVSVAFGIFAGIALVLATVGVYAVTAYAVSLRTREIGIRVALGATGRQLLWLLTRQASARLLIGLTIGMPGAWAVGRILEGGLEGVSASDPLTFAGVPLLLTVAVLTASLIPTARAARLNPAAALRAE